MKVDRTTSGAAVFLLVVVLFAALGAYRMACAGDAHVVSKVYDGDTILIDDGRRVRLIGVDAPEVASPYSRPEPFGYESKAFLESLVLGKKVTLSVGDPPRDKYGRTLAYVYVGDVLVNGRIIREGWARAYRIFPHPMRDLFIVYEREARTKGAGIWKGGLTQPSGRTKRRTHGAAESVVGRDGG